MINLKLNEEAAYNHFLLIKETIQKRAKNIIKNGILKTNVRYEADSKMKGFLRLLLIDDNLRNLIVIKPTEINGFISYIKSYFPEFISNSSPEKIILYNLFVDSCYDKSVFNKLAFIKNINIDTCPYCNRNYIYYLSEQNKIKPQIDHFFPKAKYPFLAMSFYNLIPSCQTCNGLDAKNEKDPLKEDLINPYLINNDDFEFYYRPLNSGIIGSLLDKNSVELGFARSFPGHLKVFKLQELYQLHSDHIAELIIKSKIVYSTSYREYLAAYRSKGLRFSDSEIDRMIVGNFSSSDELHMRPLSKLYQDIGKSLGLLK